MPNSLFIFDLDGTLLDTLPTIGKSMNAVLKKHRYKTFPINFYKNIIGKSVPYFIKECISPNDVDGKNIKYLTSKLFNEYAVHWVQSKPFPYIDLFLREMNQKELKSAVFSNKPQDIVYLETTQLLQNWTFSEILGVSQDIPNKPDSKGVHYISEKSNVPLDNVYIIGDTTIDVETSKNANIKSIAVTWGYSEIETLENAKPDYLVSHPKELLQLIKELS